jgi:hypothetical protein
VLFLNALVELGAEEETAVKALLSTDNSLLDSIPILFERDFSRQFNEFAYELASSEVQLILLISIIDCCVSKSFCQFWSIFDKND